MNENDLTDDDSIDDPSESLSDVTDALESTGAVPDSDDEDDAQSDEDGSEDGSKLPGPLGLLENLSGTGKSLESYRDSPVASALGDEDSKGALHIARGVDGLSPVGAMNPAIDIGIGLVLLKMERADDESPNGDTEVESGGAADDPSTSRVSEDLA